MSFFARIRPIAENGRQYRGGETNATNSWMSSLASDHTPLTVHSASAPPATPSHASLPDPNVAYQFGLQNGRKRIDPENFADYLRKSAEEEAIDAQLATLRRQEQELLTEITEIRDRREKQARLETEIPQLEARLAELNSEIEENRKALELAQEQYAAIRQKGLLSYFLIYAVSAAAFVLADIVITRVIVADALELTGETLLGLDESWYFAIALALLAVLLKPAYDRLVEEPYWDGRPTIFNYIITSVSIFVVGTLFVLGTFRTEAHAIEKQRQALDLVSRYSQEDVLPRLLDLQSRIAQNPWGRWAFILSGILFAIAGSVCLGIGMRHLQDFLQVRRPLQSRINKWKRESRKLDKERNQTRIEKAAKQSDLHGTRLWLQARPQLESLEQRLESVRAEVSQLLNQKAEVRQQRLTRLYADGYAMGIRLGEAAPAAVPIQQLRKRVRPYVAVRRAIRMSNQQNIQRM